MRRIPLTQGYYAKVDDIDYEILNISKWHLQRSKGRLYAKRSIMESPYTLRMHQIVIERILGRTLLEDEEPDHIDGDGLNNQRSNLRAVTHRENMRNQRNRFSNKNYNKLTGTVLDKRENLTKRWIAKVWVKGKVVHLGRFKTGLKWTHGILVANFQYILR
jgi:hypothetical protein